MRQSDRKLICDKCGEVHFFAVEDAEPKTFDFFRCSNCGNRTATLAPFDETLEKGDLPFKVDATGRAVDEKQEN